MKSLFIFLCICTGRIFPMQDTIITIDAHSVHSIHSDLESDFDYGTMPKLSITELIEDELSIQLDKAQRESDILKKMEEDDIKKEIDRIEQEEEKKRKHELKKKIAIIAGASTVGASVITGITLLIINYIG